MQKKSISILVPSRGRPAFMSNLCDSAFGMSDNPRSIQVIFYLDEDDMPSIEKAEGLKMSYTEGAIKYVVGQRILLSDMWNKCYAESDADINMHGGDDIVFRTKGWDSIVLKAFDQFPDRIAFVYGRDGFQPESFGTHGFLHRNWTKTVGYFVPPYFSSDYNDTWWNHVSERIGRKVFVDILTEHIHPDAGKYYVDKTHQERKERHIRDNVDQLYQSLQPERDSDVSKLDQAIDDFQNNKFKIGFVGLGKLGLPVALAINAAGHQVNGYDIKDEPKEILQSKRLPYIEAGADQLLENHSIKFMSLGEVVTTSDIIFVPIQTPHRPEYEGITHMPETYSDFEYSYLCYAIQLISKAVEEIKQEKTVVIISTVLPGTIQREIKPLLHPYVKLCYNPFFIAMGTTISDFLDPEFVLLGSDDTGVAEQVEKFYSSIHKNAVFKTSIKNAELIKVAYNTFITMKVNYANTIMELCHKLNCDVDTVTDALKMANRRLISPQYLTGGMGDGGGCHPRDNIAMAWLAQRLNLSYNFFKSLIETRELQTEWLASLAIKCSNVFRLPIVILGKAFKAGTNLTTGSPAILLKNCIEAFGHRVDTMYDPMVDINDPIPTLKAVYFIATKHEEWKKFKFAEKSVVIDPWRYLENTGSVFYFPIGKEQKYDD